MLSHDLKKHPSPCLRQAQERPTLTQSLFIRRLIIECCPDKWQFFRLEIEAHWISETESTKPKQTIKQICKFPIGPLNQITRTKLQYFPNRPLKDHSLIVVCDISRIYQLSQTAEGCWQNLMEIRARDRPNLIIPFGNGLENWMQGRYFTADTAARSWNVQHRR